MLENVFREKTVQVSFVSGVLFFLIAHKDVLKMVSDLVKKTLNVSLNGNYLLALHSALFAVLVGFLTYNVFVPLLGWNSEGQALQCDDGFKDDGSGVCVQDIPPAAPPAAPAAPPADPVGADCSADATVCTGNTYCGGLVCKQKDP